MKKIKKLLSIILIATLILTSSVISVNAQENITVTTEEETPIKASENMNDYVYTDDYGYVCFEYTGTGNKKIKIPNGVQIVCGFDTYCNNPDIEYVYIPASVEYIMGCAIYGYESSDKNIYNVLYGCRSLKKVKVSKKNEDFKTNKKGTILYYFDGPNGWEKDWQKGKKIKYFKEK